MVNLLVNLLVYLLVNLLVYLLKLPINHQNQVSLLKSIEQIGNFEEVTIETHARDAAARNVAFCGVEHGADLGRSLLCVSPYLVCNLEYSHFLDFQLHIHFAGQGNFQICEFVLLSFSK